MFWKNSPYSLRKSHRILRTSYDCYKKKWQTLSLSEKATFENNLENLEKAYLEKNRIKADTLARSLEEFTSLYCKKNFLDYTKELIIAVSIALIVATLVRAMWFEPYEIPTGSMRPTFKEQDHLFVSKTVFGINTPLMTDHLYFDPNLVQRMGTFVFSGDGLNLPDTDTTYLGIFPYKKRYVKRCIGKPGDILYFYGGKIYGIDKEGNDITKILNSPSMSKLDHVPFMSFEGRISAKPGKPAQNTISEIYLKQMDIPLGQLSIMKNGEVEGKIFNGSEWVKDQPTAQKKSHDKPQTYTDFFGMRNYAMARLLTREQVEKFSGIDTSNLASGVLYLELRHNPNLSFPAPRFVRDEYDNFSLLLTPYVTVIPLQQKHLDAIMNNMYTARFVVKGGRVRRYSAESEHFSILSPNFPGIPDGTYEFYEGKAQRITWGGITEELPKSDPLYNRDPKNIQRLFNLGIDMLTLFEPHTANQVHMPTRYAYFREGDLVVMQTPALKKDDAALIAFNENEQKREQNTSYVAFKDFGPPLKDGKIDKDFIKAFGVKMPEKHYLALGDNYAMSSDSRYFGFVPEANLQGAPWLIIWPPGDRLGSPNQKAYPWFTFPTLTIWSIAGLITLIWYFIYKVNLRRPVFKKLSSSVN